MIDYKKDLKNIYGSYKKVVLATIPKQNFLMVCGKGNPNTSIEFKKDIERLYKMSYFIKMSYKKDYVVDSYQEYKVFPLEGNWTGELNSDLSVDKETLKYELMVAQPDFVDETTYQYYLTLFKTFNPDFDLGSLKYITKKAHQAVQCLHIGSFDTEQETFIKMKQYIKEHNLIRSDVRWHKEIYLSDFRRSKPENLKTLLRYELKKK